MTTTQKYSPTPWKIDKGSFHRTNRRISIVEDRAGISYSSPIADVPVYKHDGTATAIAAFIVLAVNNHEALLEAVKELRKARYSGAFCPWCGQSQTDKHLTLCSTFQADAAIAAVEGELPHE